MWPFKRHVATHLYRDTSLPWDRLFLGDLYECSVERVSQEGDLVFVRFIGRKPSDRARRRWVRHVDLKPIADRNHIVALRLDGKLGSTLYEKLIKEKTHGTNEVQASH